MILNNPKIITLMLILAAIIGFLLGYGGFKPNQDAVASVNGEKITKDQLYDLMVKSNGEEALNSLISAKLVELETAKQNIVISDQEIQTELQKYYDNYGGEAGFNQALASNGFTLEEFKKEIVNELSIRKILEPQITITDEELKTYFEENKTMFAAEGQEANLEASEAEVREALLQTKLEEAYSSWMDSLYQQYSVKNYLKG